MAEPQNEIKKRRPSVPRELLRPGSASLAKERAPIKLVATSSGDDEPVAGDGEGEEEHTSSDSLEIENSSNSMHAEGAKVRAPRPIPTQVPEGPAERTWKILCVGEVGVGKTSYLQRVVNNHFQTGYKSTIGVDFLQKVLVYNKGRVTVHAQLWDIAGQERFGSMTRVYYREARGAIIVCDNRTAAFRNVQKWKEDIDNKVGLPDGRRNLPCLLLVTKRDLPPDADFPNEEQIKAYAKGAGFVGYKLVSAKSGSGCDRALEAFVKYMLRVNVDRLPAAVKKEAAAAKVGVVKLGSATILDEDADGFIEPTARERKCQQC
jgi:small GTP-binding protein